MSSELCCAHLNSIYGLCSPFSLHCLTGSFQYHSIAHSIKSPFTMFSVIYISFQIFTLLWTIRFVREMNSAFTLTLITTSPMVSWSTPTSATVRSATVLATVSVTRSRFTEAVRTTASARCSTCLLPRSCLCAARTALMWTRTPTCPASHLTVYSAAGRWRPSSPSSTKPATSLSYQKKEGNCY